MFINETSGLYKSGPITGLTIAKMNPANHAVAIDPVPSKKAISSKGCRTIKIQRAFNPAWQIAMDSSLPVVLIGIAEYQRRSRCSKFTGICFNVVERHFIQNGNERLCARDGSQMSSLSKHYYWRQPVDASKPVRIAGFQYQYLLNNRYCPASQVAP